jgi:predicted secreted protein
MLRTALVTTLLSAGIAGGWFAYFRFAGRRAANISVDVDGPRFDLLLQ